jgi:hypothetical protein
MCTNYHGFAISKSNPQKAVRIFISAAERSTCFPPFQRFGENHVPFKPFVDMSHPLGEKINAFFVTLLSKDFNEKNRTPAFNTLITSWIAQESLEVNKNPKLFPNSVKKMPVLDIAMIDSVSNLQPDFLVATTIGPTDLMKQLTKNLSSKFEEGEEINILLKEFNPFQSNKEEETEEEEFVEDEETQIQVEVESSVVRV